MPKDVRGGRPVPDYRRIMRADAPHLRQPIPALGTPVENANAVADKASATLARAGGSLDNPILAGLGVRFQIILSQGDTLQGLWIFRDRHDHGANLIEQVAVAGHVATFDLQIGMGGLTVPGTAESGAIKHYVRWQTQGGAVEKEFFLKGYDHDVVTLNGEAALDEDLEPVEVVVTQIDATRDWLDVPIDFFASWGDEFHVLHRRTDGDVEAGFSKAYGGVLVVSFFDTETAEESVGVQVNPVTQQPIRTRRTIQVENTEGLKEITVRFRSAGDSDYYVDVPILIRVIVPSDENCLVPVIQPCTDLLIKNGDETPEGLPSEPSSEDEESEEGEEGATAAGDLLYITVREASVGASPKVRVRRWAWVASAPALAGARLVEVGDATDYIPFSQSATTPDPGGSYGSPKRLTIVLSVAALNADNVAFMTVSVLDGNDHSEAVLIAGPKARSVQFMPIGGTGGGPTCAAY